MTADRRPETETASMTMAEARAAGMDALFQRLGAVGMVRFLQEYQTGWGDYTRDRAAWLDQEEDVRTLAERIIAQRGD